MNKYSTILITILSCTVLNARPVIPQRSDKQKLNLKGPVKEVIQYQCDFKENFGEWVVVGKKGVHYNLFNENGFSLLDAEIRKNNELSFNVYRYGVKGLSEAITFETDDYRNPELTADNIKDYYSYFFLDIEKNNPERSIYEYSGDGKIKSITNQSLDGRIKSKELYKYTDEGYETIFYRGDGSRNTDLVYEVSQKGHLVSEVTSQGFVIVSKYDDDYRLVEASAHYRAYNGSLSSATYYKYNDNGDELAYVSGTGAQKSIEGLESVYPYFKNEYRNSDSRFYEYEYDSHGNWIVKKEYGFRGDEVVIKNWWEREITYGGSGYSVIERFEKHVESLRLEKERKEAEQRAWLARPELAQPSDTLIQFMRPLFSYPDDSNKALTAILSKSGSSLRLKIPVLITRDGITIMPSKYVKYDAKDYDSRNRQDALIWILRNAKFYLLETTGLREEDQAAKEIGKIIEGLLPKLKDAPESKPGKQGSVLWVYVNYADGKVDVWPENYLERIK